MFAVLGWRWASSCSSPARTWPTCSWRGRPAADARSRCGCGGRFALPARAPAPDREPRPRLPGRGRRHPPRLLGLRDAPGLRARRRLPGGPRPRRGRPRPGLRPALSVVTGVLFGLVPALALLAPRRGGRDQGGRRRGSRADRSRSRVRSGLVVAQVALSLVLLTSAGLLLKSLRAAARLDLGFDSRGVLLGSLDLFGAGYDETKGRTFARALLTATRALPGVESATLARRVPLSFGGTSSTGVRVEGYEPPPNESSWAFYNKVGPQYFGTLRIPLVAGRDLDGRRRPGRAAGAGGERDHGQALLARPRGVGRTGPGGRRLVHRGRGGEGHPLPAARRARAARDVPAPASVVERRLHPPRSRSSHRPVGPRPGGAAGSGAARRGRAPPCRAHPGGEHPGGHRAPAPGGNPRLDLRGHRPAARGRGPLRRAAERRGRAHARDRHPHGPGRRARAMSCGLAARPRAPTLGPGEWSWAWRAAAGLGRLLAKLLLGREPPGPADLRGGVDPDAGRGPRWPPCCPPGAPPAWIPPSPCARSERDGNPAPGPALRRPGDPQEPGALGPRHPLPRPGHRRQHHDLQRGERAAPADPAR